MSRPTPRDAAALRDALAAFEGIAGDGESCPPADRIWDSVAERLTKRDNESVVLHCFDCAVCAASWRLARELASGDAATERDRSGHAPRDSRSAVLRGGWLGLAAAAAIVAAVIGIRFVREPAPVPVYRTAPEARITSEIAEGVALPRDACVLRWSSGPPGTTYDVRVTSERLQPVARAWALEQPEYRIDPGALKDVAPGTRILWRVTAHLPDGLEVASPTFRTKVE